MCDADQPAAAPQHLRRRAEPARWSIAAARRGKTAVLLRKDAKQRLTVEQPLQQSRVEPRRRRRPRCVAARRRARAAHRGGRRARFAVLVQQVVADREAARSAGGPAGLGGLGGLGGDDDVVVKGQRSCGGRGRCAARCSR